MKPSSQFVMFSDPGRGSSYILVYTDLPLEWVLFLTSQIYQWGAIFINLLYQWIHNISVGGIYIVGIHPLTLHGQQLYRIDKNILFANLGPQGSKIEYIYIEIEFLN
jgi:hypothetical protein